MKSVEPIETADWLGVFENVFNASRGVFEGGKLSVWDYSNPDDFTFLWKTLEDGGVQKASCVLIIWSKTPVDESLFPVNTSDHVSPLHWAACAAKASSRIQVCILDLNPAAHRSQYLYEHYLTCDKSRLPWLRVIQAAHLFGEEQLMGEFRADTSPVEIEAVKKRLFPQLAPKRNLTRAGHFVDRIREELTSPKNAENRHAISNIIGSMILRGGRPLSAEASKVIFVKHGSKVDFPPIVRGTVGHRFALNSILQAAGLLFVDTKSEIPNKASEELMGWLAVESECDSAGLNPADLRITLVDDQWQQGWLAWIRERLGTVPVTLQVSPDPDFLLQLLRGTGFGNKYFNLSLDFCGSQQKDEMQDILLLDLRLFTSNPTAEREFAAALEAVLTTLLTNEKASIDKQDLAVVRSQLQMLDGLAPQLSGEKHARYITVLPRLIAQMDFSLPIVIFSSTSQRDVLEQFKNFPNIITNFSKPRHFNGRDEDVVSRAESALAESFRQAIRWLRGRKLLQQIQSRPLAVLEQARKRCAGHNHFELYFDESGIPSSSRFRCAALLIGYVGGDKDTYARDAAFVHQQMGTRGLKWYPDKGSAHLEKARNEPKENKWDADYQWQDKVAEPLSEILGSRPVIPFAISRTPVSPSSTPRDDLDLAHPDALDNAFCDLIQLLLEIILIEVLPAIASDLTKVTLHIYGATRLKSVFLKSANFAAAEIEAEALWRRFTGKFGFDDSDLPAKPIQENKWPAKSFSLLYRSLRSNSMLPILATALSARGSSLHVKSIHEAIKCAIGVMLTDFYRPDATVRHQHYVCDRLAHICDVSETEALCDKIDLRVLNSWPPFIESGIGFLGRRNQLLLELIDCGRYLDAVNLPMALAAGGAVMAVDGIFAETLASRLQSVIPTLSAELFKEFCNHLSKNPAPRKTAILLADRFRNIQNTAARRNQSEQRGSTGAEMSALGMDELDKVLDKATKPGRRTK